MNRYIKNIAVLSMIIAFFGCDDYVDIDPRGEVIASSLEDVNQLLNRPENSYFYGSDQKDLLALFLSDNYFYDSNLAEDFITASSRSYLGRAINLESKFYDIGQGDATWGGYYDYIGVYNLILETLSKINDEDEETITIKNKYTGEALVQRAYHYFMLVNLYGEHYGLPKASEEGSGVPIVHVFADENQPIDRKSVNEVYKLIVDDITNALNLLGDDIAPTGDRVDKFSANALLARVYMHMGEYDKALTAADIALNKNNTLLDYNTLDVSFYDQLDVSPYRYINNPELGFFKEFRTPRLNIDNQWVFIGKFSDELVNLYHQNDLRVKWAEEEFGVRSLRETRIPIGVNVPELMLIKAECLIRTADFNDGLDLVNELRTYRFTTAAVNADEHLLLAADKTAALDSIVNERRREFHLSGMRFFDIKRYNAQDNAGISLTRGSNTYQANGANWALPIGIDIINLSNGQITQNPRD